ncbi:hemerythrin domain-containing protein [Ferruginibacter sp. SUN106]|uniref:hemerythrin domain-containing protein n=1 Tax=Ferruginibacter sp. SUN106 TaxID=2978348 RepID=UPI003D36D642
MKRHETLAPLSREHHGALILARLLQKDAPAYKGLPQDTETKAVYAMNFFKTNLQQHFDKEEILLHQVKKYNSAIEILTGEIILEHLQLTTLFDALQHTKELPAALDKLGRLLEDHIRKEERILFPLIQEHCAENILNAIEW